MYEEKTQNDDYQKISEVKQAKSHPIPAFPLSFLEEQPIETLAPN
jgi:hypothetical protein